MAWTMSDPKVVSLRGEGIPASGEPDPAVVKAAELILERARAGEIDGLAYVERHIDMSTSSGNAGFYSMAVAGELLWLAGHVSGMIRQK